MLDLLIRGATVFDGTGAPGRRGDVSVADGRVVAVGETDDTARNVIDADGLYVAPGFVDLHTDYDAQLTWDPSASPSPLHGVTTVIGGNCGFSLAPSGPAHSDYLARMMARVEGMPLSSLEQLDWSWTSFGDWLGRLDGLIGVNAGFLVGHSAVRRSVMGEAAVGSTATEEQTASMVAMLHRSLEEGALGFSTSQAHTHNDGDGSPVPSRSATRAEIEALCSAVGDHDGTTLEIIVPGCLNGFSDDEVDLMATLSLLANRPVNWNVLGVSAMNRSGLEHQLAASTAAAERGATVVALTLPHTMKIRLSFEHGAIIDGLPGWRELFAVSVPERIRQLSDPAVRRRLDEGARSKEAGIIGALANWQMLLIDETFAPENKAYEGRTVGEVAAERGQEPFDAMLDIVIADELRTGLRPPIPESEADWTLKADVWRDPRTVVGGSDAGAHLDVMCGAIYSTSLLGEGVRKRHLLSWEEAIHQLTEVPARLYGLRDRGRLTPGCFADMVLFDPDRVGQLPERTRADLPGGASRLYAEAEGIEHVMVNGTEIVRSGSFTGALPGAVLRSGRDTDTVIVPRGDGGVMTATVRAAVLHEVGAPFVVEDITLEPVGPHYVRVKMAASGVCHSDLSVQNGTLPFMFPTVLGHEGSGVVAEIGSDVTRVAVGDPVVLTWMPPCRRCFWCLHQQPMLCTTGMGESIGGPYGSVGGAKLIRGLGTATFAEETLVPEAQVVRVDPAAPLDLAALVGCALSTGIGAVWHTAGVEPGATVAVIGCGGVGLSVIQGARLAGASTIVAVDHMGAKLAAARSMGATHVVDSSSEEPVAAIQALTAGLGVDYAFEVVGRAPTIRLAFDAAVRGGTAVLVGAGSPSEQVSFSAFELFVGAKTLVGCVYGSTDPDRDFPAMVDMVTRGTIDAEGMVSRRIGLDDINDAFRAMEAGEVVRSVIVFDGVDV